jgi:tetratricopeptide (TPR) repeat protein
MELAPDHPVIYYEMGFSRMAMGEKATALELAEKGINSAIIREYDEMVPTLLDLKGSALYNLGRYEEAAAVYLLAINEYHVTSVFPFYNLGLNYYRLERDEEAADALRRALLINPNHASSNYLLGKICVEHGEKTQAFYAFCYFLLMEPNTERAVQAYNSLKDLLSMQEEILGISDNGTFTAKLEYMFTALEEQRNSGKISRSAGDELWWEFYSPFFYRIVKSEYAAVFYRYIGISADPDADSWLQTNQNEIGDFFVWLNDYFE